MKRLASLLALSVLALPLAGAAHADDKKPAKPKKNQAYVVPNIADYKLTTIALAPVTSFQQNADAEKLVRQALENEASSLKLRVQNASGLASLIKTNKAEDAFGRIAKAATSGAVPDTADLAAVGRNSPIQAVLFTNLTTWDRQLVDPNTAGQSYTQVGADYALLSLKDGATLWKGSFVERGNGPYNNPNTADVTQRDATGNSTARQAQLEPPSYQEVLEKLMDKALGTLPKPVATP